MQNIVAVSPNTIYAKRIGDSRTGVLGRGATASSAALERERYAVHAIPIVETNGY